MSNVYGFCTPVANIYMHLVFDLIIMIIIITRREDSSMTGAAPLLVYIKQSLKTYFY